MHTFNEIIKKIGEELGIKVTILSDKWLTVLEKNGQIHYIQGYKFDLNNHGIGNIMDDKGLFYDLMTYKKLPVVEQVNIYKEYNRKKVLMYYKKNNEKIIVKGNVGTCGNNVYLVKSEKDLYNYLDYLLLVQDSVSLAPFYEIENEYRVIVLNHEARIIYGKIKPEVIGDGVHKLGDLASKFNSYFSKHKVNNSQYIPKLNEKVELDFRFNLSNGAILFKDINADLKNRIIALALLVAKCLDISFGSIDIIYTKNHELLVLEANSGVMMNNYIKLAENGYDDAYQVYYDAIKLMFK